MRYLLVLLLITASSFTVKAQALYKTPSGKKYHLASCRMVENVSKKVSAKEINDFKLTACKICKPKTVKRSYTNSQLTRTNKAVGKQKQTVRCKGKTKKGTRCKHKTRLANGYCFQHSPKN